MNRGDIKLIIDLLDQVDLTNGCDERAIESAVTALETLGNQVAAQAVIIEKLMDELFAEYVMDCSAHTANLKIEALSIPTDSKQTLAEWLDEHLGLPTAWSYQNAYTDHVYLKWDKTEGGRHWVPLYRKPEIK